MDKTMKFAVVRTNYAPLAPSRCMCSYDLLENGERATALKFTYVNEIEKYRWEKFYSAAKRHESERKSHPPF
jgi:hypothetical protein